MLDEMIPLIEQISSQGAVVLLKWDGERNRERCTVVILREDSEYQWRQDTDNIVETLAKGLADYHANHEQ